LKGLSGQIGGTTDDRPEISTEAIPLFYLFIIVELSSEHSTRVIEQKYGFIETEGGVYHSVITLMTVKIQRKKMKKRMIYAHGPNWPR